MFVLLRNPELLAWSTGGASNFTMKPGTPFGGSCLPKDVSALLSFARQEGISLPLLDNTLDTNQAHLDLLLKLIAGKNTRKVGLLGLAPSARPSDCGSPWALPRWRSANRIGRRLQVRHSRLDLVSPRK
mgnify:CR=1 FL=1